MKSTTQHRDDLLVRLVDEKQRAASKYHRFGQMDTAEGLVSRRTVVAGAELRLFERLQPMIDDALVEAGTTQPVTAAETEAASWRRLCNTRIIYIAHPIGGDVEANVKRVEAIVLGINEDEPNVVPFAPYLVDLRVLDDDVPEHRQRGMNNNEALLRARFIDELRLYGDRISRGMLAEIKIAGEMDIPVRAMTNRTRTALDLIKSIKFRKA